MFDRSGRRIAQAVLTTLALVAASPSARADSLTIPLHQEGSPAVDLVQNGRVLDRDQALDLENAGQDLSLLDPPKSDIWSDTSLPAVDQAALHYPAEAGGARFDSMMKSSRELFRARVVAEDGTPFQLFMSLNAHAALARAALMRKLGYPIPSPRNYRRLKIRFASIEARTAFTDELAQWLKAALNRWVVSAPADRPELELQDVTLEPAQIEMYAYHWGAVRSRDINGHRAIRALIVPIVLADLSESANLFAWEVGKVLNDSIVLNSLYAGQWGEITLADARWIGRRIARLTRDDFREIVAAASLPEDVSALMVEKLIGRRNSLMDLLQLDGPRLPTDSHLSVGHVQKGKATQEKYDGWALRFAYGDPESPLRRDELFRYVAIEGIASVLDRATSFLNSKLVASGMSDLAQKRQDSLIQDLAKHYKDHPDQPYVRPLQTWGGPLASGSIQASRNVVTGTYYGGQSQVQLVDMIGVSASVGWFVGLDGTGAVLPSGEANVAVQRNIVHVRPINIASQIPGGPKEPSAMQQALRTDWKSLYLPDFMHGLANALQPNAPDGKDPLKGLLDKLKPDEMLIVTDTVTGGAQVGVMVPLAPLIDSAVIGFLNPSLSAGVGGTLGVLRRTTFLRTPDGFQVYFQNVNQKSLDFTFDVDFMIKALSFGKSQPGQPSRYQKVSILGVEHDLKDGEAATRAFVLNDLPKENADRKKLAIALQAVLSDNNSELLEDGFPNYRLNHETKTQETKFKFLFFRSNKVEENHLLRIRPPVDPEGRYDPVKSERVLLSHRITDTIGRDVSAFFSDLAGIAIPGFNLFSDHGGDNPVNSFMGSASWRSVTTEVELTPGKESSPVTRFEHHWGGWSLSQAKLMKLLDQVEGKIKPLNLDRPVIRRDVFATTKNLQMWEVASVVFLYDSGTEMIRKLFAPTTPIDQVFSTLIDLDGVESYKGYCYTQGRPTAIGRYPEWDPTDMGAYHTEENGQPIDILCLKPWMREVLDLRASLPDDRTERVKWTTRLMRTLDSHTDIEKLLEFVGSEHYFLEVSVKGFRTGDENGDSEYISDSVGSVAPKEGLGPFAKLAKSTRIMEHELYANYLSEGF